MRQLSAYPVLIAPGLSTAARVGLVCAITSAGVAGGAFAQLPANPRANPPTPARPPATAQENPTTPPEEIAPPANGTGKSSGANTALGNAHTGVLHPPMNVDPGIKLPTPAPQKFPMPVIPPPGTKGNQPNVVPK